MNEIERNLVLPADYESAVKEIIRLRKQLFTTNTKLEGLVSSREQIKRSMQGNLRTMLRALQNIREIVSNHCPRTILDDEIVGIVDAAIGEAA